MTELSGGVTNEHIRQSNLIEGIDDPAADQQAELAWLLLAQEEALSLEAILECHEVVTRDQLGEDAGRLRQVNVRVGQHVAPPWEQVSGLLAEWISDMQRRASLDPQEMHVRFENVHPFVDGNGRVGRMLMWWHQIHLGQPPILLRAADRGTYYAWFEEGEGNGG